ncbi:50S ribosomal protein L29 [Hornefia butyriciproducens]|jgi:large subunit ribosomal protein L29|uniref:Large ribosomal subunit protein uL29 n=1 Tax=Hornefia butyriciproducens TaxID=2652293 RepID=A0A6L5Y6M3_9FIRM|nr:50S ribosomal protein L29 [Hornefia butyriciproducens]MCI7327689.1 50S ribosomal protein L29 [Clostridiales bacterium]MCI7412497.1 50S ribosomal protein L29 [Clostridiales bacterium]MCI7680321.1 50S ribosomal protein L29 [Clostridiales bacterium]MDD6300002.1 50S ribosomal protein L29 [Hornefia butyriciproducens]MDD7019200.1 50S ribosomal protein L29 [Hornefia butyriciproducens]
MDLNKMREMTDVELNAELDKMKKELFNLRFQHVTGQLENPVKMREVKRNIARVKTIIREKELEEVQA